MTTQHIADRVVALSRQGKSKEAYEELFADHAVAIEMEHPDKYFTVSKLPTPPSRGAAVPAKKQPTSTKWMTVKSSVSSFLLVAGSEVVGIPLNKMWEAQLSLCLYSRPCSDT